MKNKEVRKCVVMALIKCPECGKEVSNQLKKCNNCGYKLKQVDKKKKKIIIIAGVVILALAIVASIVGVNISKSNQEKSDKEYHDQIVVTSSKIYVNALVSNLYCYDIGKVWYNAIFDKFSVWDDYYQYKSTDFNESIAKYLTKNKDKIDKLKEQQKEIKEEVLKLQKKPNEKYKDAYDKMIELYGAFNNLVDQATSPSGTYKDYVAKYHQYSEDLNAAYEQLVVLIPEIKDYKANMEN